MMGTATHQCPVCEKKTTHRVLVGKLGTNFEGATALQCVVCGNLVDVEIKP